MAQYALFCYDKPNSLEKRLQVRPRHLERLQTLLAQGKLVIAGALPVDHSDISKGFTGSLIIVNFATDAEVEAWVKDEPFLLEGVYERIDIKPFKQALP